MARSLTCSGREGPSRTRLVVSAPLQNVELRRFSGGLPEPWQDLLAEVGDEVSLVETNVV
jgi:hypothetical protein